MELFVCRRLGLNQIVQGTKGGEVVRQRLVILDLDEEVASKESDQADQTKGRT